MRIGVRPGLRLALALLVGVAAAGAAACTTLIGAEDIYYSADGSLPAERDGTTPGADATPRADDAGDDAGEDAADSEAAAADAGEDADQSADAGSDGNVVDNPSFENGIVADNCGTAWNVEQAGTITTSTLARTGAASCELCNSGQSLGYLATDLPIPEAGTVIVASVWFAVLPDGADAGKTSVGVAVCYQGCNTAYSESYTPEPVPSWTLLRGQQVTVEADASSAQLQIAVTGGCVLVDDVTVVYQ